MKKKSKIEIWPKHMMGKWCGYELYEDGGIKVAPTHSDKMAAAIESEVAINALLEAMTKQCHALMLVVTKEKSGFWNGVKEDYGLDTDKTQYTYDHATRTISKAQT